MEATGCDRTRAYEQGIEPEDLPDILTRPVPEFATHFVSLDEGYANRTPSETEVWVIESEIIHKEQSNGQKQPD